LAEAMLTRKTPTAYPPAPFPSPHATPQALDRLRRTAGGGGDAGADPKGPRSKLQASAAQEFVIGLLSGAAAGMAVDLTLYPLDTIKTRLQASSNARFSLKTLQVGGCGCVCVCVGGWVGVYTDVRIGAHVCTHMHVHPQSVRVSIELHC
jgi:hypothetical protein